MVKIERLRTVDIISKKRDGESLSKAEIDFFIDGYVKGQIPDYQAAALLMAIYLKGMDSRETADLTMTMVESGDRVDLTAIKGIKVDKHSTGGVGDTTTLIVAPLVAACGVPVAKMSGRGLGHTGGTLDKLESIPGFRTELSKADFIAAVNKVGLAVIGQSKGLVPADSLLYALRDVTATVASLPLIASSIMSKKIAAGAGGLVLDVKTGSGAFMETREDAFDLAREMVKIGERLAMNTTAIITDMNQPLGLAVGNALEVKEAISILRGLGEEGPLKAVSLLLAAHMIYTGAGCTTIDEGKAMAKDALESGRGLDKLAEMIRVQGGDARVVDDISLLPQAKHIMPVTADMEGYIASIDTEMVGIVASILGAGRTRKDQKIDPAVGLVLKKRLGDKVKKGEELALFHLNDRDRFDQAQDLFKRAIRIGAKSSGPCPLVYGTVTREGEKHFS